MMAEYLTVVECLRQNGYRHYCNGYRYLEHRMFKHALGSFAKAQKNYDRAELLDFPFEFREIVEQLGANLARNILYGS